MNVFVTFAQGPIHEELVERDYSRSTTYKISINLIRRVARAGKKTRKNKNLNIKTLPYTICCWQQNQNMMIVKQRYSYTIWKKKKKKKNYSSCEIDGIQIIYVTFTWVFDVVNVIACCCCMLPTPRAATQLCAIFIAIWKSDVCHFNLIFSRICMGRNTLLSATGASKVLHVCFWDCYFQVSALLIAEIVLNIFILEGRYILLFCIVDGYLKISDSDSNLISLLGRFFFLKMSHKCLNL